METLYIKKREETSTPYKICWECRINDESPTGKENTTIEWNVSGKIGKQNKLILTEIFPLVRKIWYLKVLNYMMLKCMTKLKTCSDKDWGHVCFQI